MILERTYFLNDLKEKPLLGNIKSFLTASSEKNNSFTSDVLLFRSTSLDDS